MANTQNYNLSLPELTEKFNIETINNNTTILDTKPKEVQDSVPTNVNQLEGSDAFLLLYLLLQQMS